MPRRRTSKKGGVSLDSIGSTLSGWGTSIKQGASDAYNKTKQGVSSAYDSTKSAISSTTSAMGGRRRTRRRRTHGGSASVVSKTPLNGLAAHAAPVSNVPTAKPHNIVGGKSRRHRKHRHYRSCKH
jgi:hypothetical protein